MNPKAAIHSAAAAAGSREAGEKMRVRFIRAGAAFLVATGYLCAAATVQENARDSGRPLLALKHFGGEGEKLLAAERSVESFPLYEEPGGGKVIARVRLVKGRKLAYDDVRMLVYRFGEAEVRADKVEHEIIPMQIQDGQILSNSGPRIIKFPAGEKLELVAYVAEGYHAARYNGDYIQINGEDLKILRWEDAETWVRLKDLGRKSGWAKVGSEDITIVGVRF